MHLFGFTIGIYHDARPCKRQICIILPFVLCGCETWSVTVREEPELRKTFEHKRDEVTGVEETA